MKLQRQSKKSAKVMVVSKHGDQGKKMKMGDGVTSGINVDAESYMVAKESGGLDQIDAIYGSAVVEVQHDGVTPHVGKGNLDKLNTAGKLKGRSLTLLVRPPNSPDMNRNDLAFFYSLQCDADTIDCATCNVQQ